MAQDRKSATNQDAGRGTTSQQVRDDIDAGRTGEKVDYPDPATAPLGTDAEAGGAPASTQSPAPDRRTDDTVRNERRVHGAEPRNAALPWLIALVVAIVVIAGLAWFFAAQ